MQAGIICLVLGYVLSQFYRAFLAVLAPVLKEDIGATPEQLSLASGMWFLIFALMQLPVGAALDRIGPRLTSSVLLAVGGAGGAVLFALAQTPTHITVAMGLIGIGCSPVLMSAYYIFAKDFAPALFATLAGVTLGLGTIGNVASSLPMTWAVGIFGWRETVFVIAALTFGVAVLLFLTIRDPKSDETEKSERGSVLDLLKMPVLWPIFAMMLVNYSAAAGIRGLWIGPYMQDVYALDVQAVGTVTLIMGLAMIVGNFVYGPMDRFIPSKKTIILGGNLIGATCCLALGLLPAEGIAFSVVLLSAIGFFGASFAVVIAHGRHFFPAHLTGRGVTLLNLFGIGGAGVMQSMSGRLHTHMADQSSVASDPYQALFLFFGVALLAGCCVYAFSKDVR